MPPTRPPIYPRSRLPDMRCVSGNRTRCLVRRVESGAPWSVNLHVLSPESGAHEIERILAFRDRLRTHDDDRAFYEHAKRRLAQRRWKFVQHYANAKSEVIEEILGRALSG
ncbi:GrpB family protein [Nocardia sp. NPDC019375]|uniref:GrpB family protein n=2 Tax=Nocardia TaxID=1817 RepID=UPI0033CF4B58